MGSILIADDNPENLKVLSRLLKQAGYKVRAATNGKQALDSFKAEPPDLVLLDIQMPQMDGYEVCRMIKKQACYRLIPVIFISAMGEAFNKAMAFESGGNDYITKPIYAEEVLARVRTHLSLYKYQKELQDKNFELLHQFKNTFEQAAVGIAHIDIHTGQYLKVNTRFAEILGYSRDELLEKTVKDITHPDFYGDDSFKVEQLKSKEIRFFINEKKYLTADGSTVWCKVTVSFVENNQGKTPGYLLSIIEDISRAKKMEREQNERERLVEQLKRMEAIGTLAGGIAHDFNNILSAIIGFTEISLEQADKGSVLEENLQEVYSAGKRARDLVKQILAVSRQSDEKISPIQPGKIVNEVLKLIRSSTPATIEISHRIESDASIMGNATQVHQLLMNLCTNAVQAMEDTSGVLSVRMKEVHQNEKEIFMGMKPGPYIEIKVSDTGVGIPAKFIKQVFDPYFTTKGPGEGTGLGLATVHGIIKSYQGKIDVESRPGQGTTFTIHLPVCETQAAPQVVKPGKMALGKGNILIVDDELSIVKMETKLLERLGYCVTAQTCGLDALALFKKRPEAFDLVLTDMTMTDITGDKLAMELMAVRPDIPIVLCTGYSKKISSEAASKMGIRAFIYKPFSMAELAKTIKQTLYEANRQHRGG